MSQNFRPRIAFNAGIPRTRTVHYYWCRICRRIIRISLGNPLEISITCPFCSRNLRHELDVVRARFHGDPSNFLQDSGNHMTNTNSRRMIPRWTFETDDPHSLDSWITLQFSRPSENSNPAANSDMEAIRRVKITESHLQKDSSCAICKEEFEIGGEVRELPCRHFYHSDCIVPWLRIHNTCPICRYTLQNAIDGESSEESVEEGDGRGNGWWNVVRSWWPFRVIGDLARRLGFADYGDNLLALEPKYCSRFVDVLLAG
ncbi:uncharacterized protein LOC111447704 isoform X1 [Cucurbita moschata]|uniref:RING-type E3 ubiquitin transferase n=1 Tax=Cucurbita moschata TaxID=3662 RepID=A0A6J1FWW3_CUCMO|nr:uncharacterized protein LOC111447704 isoform X1 [Cucurbita moschata]XP_022942765.1 uncharacterized protein LOC111447704 isoform X1 [Cucurbita moschata]